MALIKGNHLPQEKQHSFHSLVYSGNIILIPKHHNSRDPCGWPQHSALTHPPVSVRRVKAFTGAECRGPRFPVSRLAQRRVWKLLREKSDPEGAKTSSAQDKSPGRDCPPPMLGLSIVLVQEEKK